MSSGSEETSRSAPDSPVIGLIETPTASFPSADTAEKPANQALKHLIILRLLKEPSKLVDQGESSAATCLRRVVQRELIDQPPSRQ